MNDTEKIEGLINELEEIEEEQKDNVPVITKEYNIGDEEPTTEQEKTKIMESIQENIEQEPEEEQKEEVPVLVPLPDKNKQKKKRITIILAVAIVVVLIATICVSVLTKPKEKKKKVTNDDVLSYEEYKKIVKDYGDAVTKAYKEFKEKNKTIIPVMDDLEIDYKDHVVTCKDTHFNEDGTVYLTECSIKGYDSEYKYKYGTKEEETSKYKLYLYKYEDIDVTFTSTKKEEENENSPKLIKTISCETEKCKGYTSKENKDKYIVLLDNNKLYLYNLKSDIKKEIKNLEAREYASIKILYNSNNKPTVLAIDDNRSHNMGYYVMGKEKMITDFTYEEDQTTKRMVDAGYLANYDGRNNTLSIINQLTGEVQKTVEIISFSINDFTENGTNYYQVKTSYEEEYCLLDSNFEKVEEAPTTTQETNTEEK